MADLPYHITPFTITDNGFTRDGEDGELLEEYLETEISTGYILHSVSPMATGYLLVITFRCDAEAGRIEAEIQTNRT